MPRSSGAATVDATNGVQDAIIHAALEGIITVDEEQRIVLINPAAQRMFGVQAADVLGRNLSQFIPARLRAEHAQHVDRFRLFSDTDRAMAWRRAVFGLRADGQEFPVQASISRTVTAGAEGPRTLTTVLLRDLSPFRDLQESYDALEKRFHLVVELAPNAIWLTRDDKIVYANRASAGLFGAPESRQLVGHSVLHLIRPESRDKVRNHLADVLSGRRVSIVSTERIARLDGGVREVEVAIVALPALASTLQMVLTDVTERQKKVRRIERSRRDLLRLAKALDAAREDERRRIARELHDELAQRLTALKFDLTALASVSERAAHVLPKTRIDDMLATVDETVAAVRRIASDLRPSMLDDLGLTPAIEWLAGETMRRTGMDIHLTLADCDADLDEPLFTTLYRVVQEALTNVVRHARAQSVWIDLYCTETDVLLTVEDNGTGFPAQQRIGPESFGLLGMRERVRMLGGHLELKNRSEGGACIRVRLPLKLLSAGSNAIGPEDL